MRVKNIWIMQMNITKVNKFFIIFLSPMFLNNCNSHKVIVKKNIYELSKYQYVDPLSINKPYMSVVGYKHAESNHDANLMVKYIDYKRIMRDALELDNDSICNLLVEKSYIEYRINLWNLTMKKKSDEKKANINRERIIFKEFIRRDNAIVHINTEEIYHLYKCDNKWLIYQVKKIYKATDTIP